MSPEIKVNGKTIAVVPDETGIYRTDRGLPIYVNTDGIEASNNRQSLILEALEIGGRREIGVTQQGIGSSQHPKLGDGLLPDLSVRLIHRPIRVSYRDQREDRRIRKWVERTSATITMGDLRNRGYYETVGIAPAKVTYKNPYWQKNHGRGG